MSKVILSILKHQHLAGKSDQMIEVYKIISSNVNLGFLLILQEGSR